VAFETERTRWTAFLFAILRPGTVKAAWVDTEKVRLTFRNGPTILPLGNLEEVNATDGLVWSRVRVRHSSGSATISGLSQNAAAALVHAIETARHDWWRRVLGALVGALKPVHERVSQLSNPPKYFTMAEMRVLRVDARKAASEIAGHWPKSLSDAPEIQMLRDIRAFLESPEDARHNANKAYLVRELIHSQKLLDTIESRPLTKEQRKAVLVDEHRNLVIAAAGSGKTSVIVAKVGWLLHRGHRMPQELLLLAFARDAGDEMRDRLKARFDTETALRIRVRTFHSLGMEIIGKAEGRRPSLSRAAESRKGLLETLKGIIDDLFADSKLSTVLRNWFQGEFAPYKSEHDFKCWGEYYDYIRKFGIRSLKGEAVRSFEECEIANFLYLNGIEYQYEAPYEHDTATLDKRQYKPDFHLPGHGIYIEHFGIDANGRTASFVDQGEYVQGMEWKRKQHADNGTTLIETYSHEHADGRLLRNLTTKLASQGVTLAPVPQDKVFEVLQAQGRINPFTDLVATFLQHFKGGRLSLPDLARRAQSAKNPVRALAFLAVFRPIYDRYQEMLSRSGEIDFHDMINRATDLIESGRFRSPFKYILVDEFQDISPSRAALLKALLDNSPGAQLFAVGDDWQAILRFAGSDIAIMREFGDQFGDHERIDLGTTFRCSDHIAEVATKFVLRNPAQISKNVRSTFKADGPAVWIGLPDDEGLSLLTEALDRIADHSSRYEGTSDVLLMGRYKHLRPQSRHMATLRARYPGLRFFWRTIHGSKGLEADYAVVLGACSGKHGFPAEMADDPLLNLVLAAPEAHPNAEERRLLYVALTRAKRQIFLLADGGSPSSFVNELIGQGYDVEVFGRPPAGDVACPSCGTGKLRRRENTNNGNFFYGCSNFPLCGHISRPCPVCGNGLPIKEADCWRCHDCGAAIDGCPSCDGWLEERMGPHGRFLGCSNYPECRYTRNLQEK